MSGNPFRLSTLSPSQEQASAVPAPPVSFLNPDTTTGGTAVDYNAGPASSQPPARTKKSVRIESPTSSPPHSTAHDIHSPLFQRETHSRYAGSPPPASAGFVDNFGGETSQSIYSRHAQGEDAMKGSSYRHDNVGGSIHSPTGAPVNPFSRTLATIEPQERGSSEPAGQHKEPKSKDRPLSMSAKGNLDVEGFKRLLMTGIPSSRNNNQPQQPSAAPNTAAAPTFESSSSTDTSSVSRQSIFEPVQEPHPETPRTSYEMSPSDDETVGLVDDSKKSEKKKKPPLPKHRHGKLVSARTPQTVPFDDFSAAQPAGTPSVREKRANSDLNKPLPDPPVQSSPPPHIVSQHKMQEEPLPMEPELPEPSNQPNPTPPQKKMPPPVPIARRQSQLRTSTTTNRSRSNSSLTMSSQHSVELPVGNTGSESTSTSTQKAPPPPPPSRRHGASLTGGNASSANSSTTELPSTSSRRSIISSPTAPSTRKATFPSPPPSPDTAHSSLNLARTSSVSSRNSTARVVSNESTNSGAPPPPPPPRRRQSGRSSLDKERPYHPAVSSPAENERTRSDHGRSSFDSKRRTSVASESSLRHVYTPSSENEHALYSPKEEREEPVPAQQLYNTTSSTILDDMEQFQKEIDALRDKYKQNA